MSHPFATLPDGRAQRRAQIRAKARMQRKPARTTAVDPAAPLRKLFNAAPHDPAEIAGEHVKMRTCFDRLRAGTTDTDDFDHLAMTLNMCKERALEIDDTLADMLERAQDAMDRCKERYNRLGHFGFDGPGMLQVLDSLDACEAIIDASSPLQMSKARDIVADQIYGKGTAARLKQEVKRARMGVRGVA